MTDHQFHALTAAVASMFPYTNADAVIARLKGRAAYDSYDGIYTIESNVWGWRIVSPDAIISEGLATLDDAIKICEALKMSYKIRDIQEPDAI